MRETDVRESVPRIQRQRAFEVRNRGGHSRRIERLELEPAFGERAVGFQIRRLARTNPRRRRRTDMNLQARRQLRHD